MITAAEFAKGGAKPTSTPISSKFITAASFAQKNPPPPPTIIDKAKGVGISLVKGVVEPVATMVARPIQLGAQLLGASDEEVNRFTKEKFGDWIAPTPQNTQDLYKDVGRGVQTALTGGIGSTLKSAVGVAATKGVAPAIGGLAKVGALEGAGFGLGVSMEQGNDILSKETAQNVALGAGIGVVAPVAFKGLGRLMKGKAGRALEDAAIKEAENLKLQKEYNLQHFGTESGVPLNNVEPLPIGYRDASTPLELPAPRTKEQIPIELPSPGILEAQANQRASLPTPELPKSPLVQEAEKFASKSEYVKFKTNNQDALSFLVKKSNKTYKLNQPLPEKLSVKQLARIWEEAHPLSETAAKKPLKTVSEYVQTQKPPTVTPEAPITKPIAPEVPVTTPEAPVIRSNLPTPKENIAKGSVEILKKDIPENATDELRQYINTTNEQQIKEVMSHDFAYQKDIALGRKTPLPGEAPPTAYRAHLENIAQEMANKGDVSLAEELSKTKVVKSESGAALQSNQISSKNNIVEILSDVRKAMTDKIPNSGKIISKLESDLKMAIEKTKTQPLAKPTREVLMSILEDLKCQ